MMMEMMEEMRWWKRLMNIEDRLLTATVRCITTGLVYDDHLLQHAITSSTPVYTAV